MKTYGKFTEAEPGNAPPGMYVPLEFPTLVLLDTETRDGRTVASEGFSPLDLPRSIKLKTHTSPGHEGAEVAGRIDEVTVHDDGHVSGRGWALNDTLGRRAAFLVKTQALRGNSIDMSVAMKDVQIRFEEPEDDDDNESYSLKITMKNARMAATTLCTEPAFDNAGAFVPDGWEVEGIDEPDAIVASVKAVEAEETPHAFAFSYVAERPKIDAERFADPKLTEPTPVFVDEGERVFGHIACWDSDHLGEAGLRPPRSYTNYAYFAKYAVHTTDGFISTGPLVLGGNHAPDTWGYAEAIDHYANTHSAWADVSIGEDEFGIWVAGTVRPGTSDVDLHVARASGQSGDWRRIGANLELIASQCVSVEGFQKPRASAFGHDQNFMLSLTGAGALAPAKPKLVLADGVVPPELRYLANRFAAEDALKLGAEFDNIGDF